jgi:hypothetical protein
MMTRRLLAAIRDLLNTLRMGVASLCGGNQIVVIAVKDAAGPQAARALRLIAHYAGSVGQTAPHSIRSSIRWWDLLTARAVLCVDVHPRPWVLRAITSCFDVDQTRNPAEGWEWCRLAQQLDGQPTASRRREAHHRLTKAVSRTTRPGLRRVYAFGTGPSLASSMDRSFRDGYVIVCNTIVRDRALWEHLHPDFVVAGDAIYHFGHTEHATAFRADLHERLRESRDTVTFVYPELFDAIVRHEFHDVEHLLVPVPFGRRREAAYSLVERFELPPLSNVLNILLLPLAATLSREIGLWGFDGRAPKDTFFWANSSRQSYPEHMPALRTEHPAFFGHFVPAGNEAKYAETVHGDMLEALLSSGEKLGFRYTMLHWTWTATLQKRMVPGLTEPRPSGPHS